MFTIALLSIMFNALAFGGEKTKSIPNFHEVHDWLYRGGRPDREDVANLKERGVRTIVDLERTLFDPEPEVVNTERTWTVKAGIRFEHIPLHPIKAPSKSDIERALSLIADPSNRPVYVHCNRGSDRTGIVAAAYRIRYDGWTVEDAFEEMKKYGYRTILLFWWKNRLIAFVNE
jgi:protein tyrosine/serine phosphatase